MYSVRHVNLKTDQRKITSINILLLRAPKNHLNRISHFFKKNFKISTQNLSHNVTR